MENEQRGGKRIMGLFKKLFLDHLGIKIAAVVFATVIWGVVLTTQDQPRIKVITNVPVSFVNEYELHNNRELVVRGNPLASLRDGITVHVSVPISGYLDFSKDDLSASINLNSVVSTGTALLDINVTSMRSYINVVEYYSPNKLEMEIDKLMTLSVPVEAVTEGTLPDGYYADMANVRLSESRLTISGPEQDARRVSKAQCKIPLGGRTQSYNDTLELALFDKDGNEIDSTLFVGGLPTVTVTLPVYARKTVPINVEASLVGTDNLAANFELASTIASPETIDIIGDAKTLKGIEYLTVQKIDVTGRNEGLLDVRALNIPDGVKLLNSNIDTDAIEVFVDIREKMTSRDFLDLPITYRNLGKGLSLELSPETMDLTVQGRVRLVDLLDRNDIEVYVDVKDLKRGEHEADIVVYLGDDETTLELSTIYVVTHINVKIT